MGNRRHLRDRGGGLLGFIFMRVTAPAFFKKQTLTRGTPTLVPDEF
jgi:hypothetical protein